MNDKVGRNDLCPCGSGKKFKKCCINIYGNGYRHEEISYKLDKLNFSEYLDKHESGHVLDLITALQLIPENYGKNYRIEVMAIEAMKKLSTGKPGNLDQLRSILLKEFPRHYAEDLPEELFTENVLFHGGNFVVMPGINSYCTDIFKYLAEAIYATDNNFSKEFKNEIYQGVSLMLNVGSQLFERTGLKRNLFIPNHEQALQIPKELPRLSFNLDELVALCAENNINPEIIEHFTTKSDAPEFSYDDPTLSPLLFRPLVRFKDEYRMLLPSGQMSAINEYILKIAKKYNVRPSIHEYSHNMVWRDIWGACDKMSWILTDIPLPEMENQLSIKERIFQFDSYMLAYVVYTFSPELKGTYELYEEQNRDLFSGDSLNQRTEDVIAELKTRKELEGYQFLTLYLTNSMGGGFSAFGINKEQLYELKVWFSVFDFLTLAYADEWGRLDLWKYAKVYKSTTEEAQIVATSSIDAYAIYKRNGETFYLSDENRFTILSIVPGDGADITRRAKINSDVHGALSFVDKSFAYQQVRRYREYAPIYKPVNLRIQYEMLLESYNSPIWIQNYQAKNQTEADLVEHIADAIFFWLDKLHPILHNQLDQTIPILLNIVLEFEQTFFNPLPLEKVNSRYELDVKLQCSYTNYTLTYKFPPHILKLFVGGDNSGERILMTELLKGFNGIPDLVFSDQFIIECIDQYVPIGQAKMILLIDSRMDIQLDNRWLLPTLYISDAEINLLLDKLISIVNSPEPIPEKFQSTVDKKRFCNQVVLSLTQYLMEKLRMFDNEKTLNRLIDVNESLIHKREFGKIKTSAQIFCFGNDEKVLENILKKERSLVNTSLSTRCLIEFIVLNPATGNRKPSFDQLDELLTIMNEILNYGMLSDILHFEMANPEIGLLPSGRIGISKEFYDEKLQPFHKDNTVANIEAQLETFSTQFETYTSKGNEAETETFYNKVDEAFLDDWGINFTNLIGICYQAAAMAERQEDSVISILEDELIVELKRNMEGAENQVERGLEKLRFDYNPTIISDQTGYTNSDYFPWKYNRDFSYARRPFVVTDTKEGRRYYWGMRHCLAAGKYLQQLLNSGRLTHGGSKISSLLGEINKKNGKQFRNTVVEWLKCNTQLFVWDNEVTMRPGGHFDTDKDYGDCDIVAFDQASNQVYNIECKRTEAARNIHQMKNEMDTYLGRNGQKRKIAKHMERDIWLQANLNQVKILVGAVEQPKVKSLILTSELIPTRYLRSVEIPLPILSYGELHKMGIVALKEC